MHGPSRQGREHAPPGRRSRRRRVPSPAQQGGRPAAPAITANMALGPDGRWTALHSADIFHHGRTAGFIYQSVLRHEVAEAVERRLRADGHARHRRGRRHPAKPIRNRFSRRRVAIEAAMAEHGVRTSHGAQIATLDTRPAKPPPVSEEAGCGGVARSRRCLRVRPHPGPEAASASAPAQRPGDRRPPHEAGRHVRPAASAGLALAGRAARLATGRIGHRVADNRLVLQDLGEGRTLTDQDVLVVDEGGNGGWALTSTD